MKENTKPKVFFSYLDKNINPEQSKGSPGVFDIEYDYPVDKDIQKGVFIKSFEQDADARCSRLESQPAIEKVDVS